MFNWISVKDKLPEPEKEVLLYCITGLGYHYQCVGFFVPKGMHREDSSYSWDYEYCDEYDEEIDDYFVNSGWYESVQNWDDFSAVGIVDEVTHWMKLPEFNN